MTNAPAPLPVDAHTAVVGSMARVSWGAILAGAVVALSLQLLLNLAGMGLDLTGDSATLSRLPEWESEAGLYWAVTSLVSLLLGGWVAGRLAGVPLALTALLHGVTVWALVTLLAVCLAASPVKGALPGAFGAIGVVAALATQTADNGVEGDSVPPPPSPAAQAAAQNANEQRVSVMRSIRGEARDLYRRALDAGEASGDRATNNPAALGQDLNRLVDRLFASGGRMTNTDLTADLERLVTRYGLTRAEASRVVAGWAARIASATSLVDEAVDAINAEADAARQAAQNAVAAAAGWMAFALFLGLVAALVGGVLGRPSRLVPGQIAH